LSLEEFTIRKLIKNNDPLACDNPSHANRGVGLPSSCVLSNKGFLCYFTADGDRGQRFLISSTFARFMHRAVCPMEMVRTSLLEESWELICRTSKNLRVLRWSRTRPDALQDEEWRGRTSK